MKGVQSFFRYVVFYTICGIPFITLKGNPEDWRRLSEKICILKEFNLSVWYGWLKPIISEFVRAASGVPNKLFWKQIVMITPPEYISTVSRCIPNDDEVNGWCVVMFPCPDNFNKLTPL